MINRFCKVLYLSLERRSFALLSFFSACLCVLTVSDVHLTLGLDIWFVFWVLSFGHLFKSSYFLLFAFFLVEKLLFLFYPHSSEILFAQSQCKISFKSWFMYLFICFRELLEYRRLVSSAKWCITECWITLLRSLIHIQNSSRPKTEPCSTPWVLINAVDSLSFTYVYCFLLVKYNLISLKGVSLIP